MHTRIQFASILFAAFSILSVSSFGNSTTVTEHQHNRELATNLYKIFQFVCNTTVYQCGGRVVVPAASACKVLGAVTNFSYPNVAQCTNMITEARKTLTMTQLYKNSTLCPNSTPQKKVLVRAYSKYYLDGTNGQYCTSRGCGWCKGAEGFGDPHFVTYDGTPYSYHGECDLVLAKSTEFGNGLGLRVHGRTEIVDNWSRISSVAISIGKDTLELTNTGNIYWNGNEMNDVGIEFPSLMGGMYKVTKHDKSMNDVTKVELTIHIINEGKSKIKVTLFKKVIAVHVGSTIFDLEGMLGSQDINGFVGRNKVVLYDANEMGANWQVRSDMSEPMLFHKVRAPQFPETCQLPSNAVDENSRRRKLRGLSQNLQHRAAKVCAHVTEPYMHEFCVHDVLQTGDIDLARAYLATTASTTSITTTASATAEV